MRKRTLFTTIGLLAGTAFAYKKLDEKVNDIPEELKRKEVIYEFEGDFGTITITEEFESLIIRPSTDDKVRLTCYENDEYYYNILEGEDLVINSRPTESNLKKVEDIIRRDKHLVILEIPKRLKCNLVARAKNSINVEHLSFANLNVVGKNGNIIVRELNIENNCSIENKNGTVNVEKIETTYFNCKNANSNIIVYDVIASGNIILESKNANITGVYVSTKEVLSVENKNGNIKLNSLELGTESFIENKNGNIKIVVNGEEKDYNICTMANLQCSVNVPKGNKEGRPIYLENKNGNIELSFE